MSRIKLKMRERERKRERERERESTLLAPRRPAHLNNIT